jgi:U3 small nucleolar RNA-associated protein 22
LQAEFRPAETAGTTLLFGLELDESKARRLIDLGPAADDKAAAGVFRAFWGAKSEMRRFKDGSILEAVIWTQSTDDSAASPFELWAMRDMAAHVLQRHLSINALAMCSSPLEGLILAPNQQALSAMGPCAATAQQRPLHVKGDDVTPTSHLNNVDHTQAFVPLRTAFEKLEKGLRAAPGLPLTIVNVQPVHAAFRHCSVFVPLPVDLGCRECEPLDQLQTLAGAYGVGAEIDESIDINTQVQMRARYSIEPIDVELQFESSSKWPTDVTAIARIKTAFYLRIAQVMLAEHSLTSAVAEEFVDIFVDGFLFRVRLLHEKEIHLLKQDDSPLASALERTLVHQPQHAIAMKGFQFRFQLFGPTVRLAQRWVASHLFSADLQPACVELLVAHVFAHPLPFAAPSSTLVAFLRFLRVLATYSFSESPLVIDFDGTMSAEQVAKVHTAFNAARGNEKTSASRALWLATPRDPNSLLWTSSSPSASTLERIAQYARASLNHLTTVVSGDVAQSKAQWLTAFRTPLSLFDAFIVLDERAMCSAHHALFPIRLPVHVAEASDDEDEADDVPANKKAKLSSSIKPPPASKSRSQAAHDSAVSRAETLAHRQASVLVGLNAADRYVNALRTAFSSVAEFHYDALAPSLIAVKYHTLPEGGNSFSVAQAAFSKPVFGTNGSLSKLEQNLTQLSLEFKRMGAGIAQAVLSSHAEYKQFLASQ